MVTVPAVNAKEAKRKNVGVDEIDVTMQRRMAYVLEMMAYHGHRDIVLGSFGCGVFGNDIEKVYRGFRSILHNDLAGYFDNVYFPCTSKEHYDLCCSILLS